MEEGLTTNHIKEPNSKRQNFDDLMVYDLEFNTIDKIISVQNLEKCNDYFVEIETKVESMCIDLRVRIKNHYILF